MGAVFLRDSDGGRCVASAACIAAAVDGCVASLIEVTLGCGRAARPRDGGGWRRRRVRVSFPRRAARGQAAQERQGLRGEGTRDVACALVCRRVQEGRAAACEACCSRAPTRARASLLSSAAKCRDGNGPGYLPFADVCLGEALRQARKAVVIDRDGPWLALTDGNALLRPLGWGMNPISVNKVRSGALHTVISGLGRTLFTVRCGRITWTFSGRADRFSPDCPAHRPVSPCRGCRLVSIYS